MMFLTDQGRVCDTVISDNIDLSGNNTLKSTYIILYSLHIGGAKYRIYLSKTETATNITIQKMTKRVESNTIFRLLIMKEQFTQS